MTVSGPSLLLFIFKTKMPRRIRTCDLQRRQTASRATGTCRKRPVRRRREQHDAVSRLDTRAAHPCHGQACPIATAACRAQVALAVLRRDLARCHHLENRRAARRNTLNRYCALQRRNVRNSPIASAPSSMTAAGVRKPHSPPARIAPAQQAVALAAHIRRRIIAAGAARTAAPQPRRHQP